ncbi:MULTISPECIES: PepSY-like domain-containing protein [Nostocales]|uniref:PepSY-like domain-containing protein n=1 Tax=Nostocales TaxID=1161 RepID=UPI001F5557DA|nr:MULTISPECIES: PepSY-like domain-containing protein [Nostocales]
MMPLQKTIVGIFNAVLVLAIAGCDIVSNQDKLPETPASVESAFTNKYSEKPRLWQRNYYGYEATFIKKNVKYEAEFSETGEWLETEYYVTEKEFPDVILKRIRQEYPTFKITKYEIEITPKGNFYEVDITDGEMEYELYFDVHGNTQVDMYED